MVSELKCELRVANYNVSSNKVNEGFGKCNANILNCKGKGKVMPLQAGVAQRVGRGIALLFIGLRH